MNQPLELTWYPLNHAFPAGYILPRDSRITHRAANRMAHAKRLTDAEAAAEFHAQDTRVRIIENGPHRHVAGPSAYRKLEALRRAATLPSYDEALS